MDGGEGDKGDERHRSGDCLVEDPHAYADWKELDFRLGAQLVDASSDLFMASINIYICGGSELEE